MQDVIYYITEALDSGSRNGAGFKCSASLSHLLEICRISFLCAGRAKSDIGEWEAQFLRLTGRLAGCFQSLSYHEPDDVDDMDVFRSQCVLGMAMKLHQNVPGIVGDLLFHALHKHSVKIFELRAKKERWYEMGCIRRRDDVPSSPSGVSHADWEKVVIGEESFGGGFTWGNFGIWICSGVNDGGQWYQEDLQLSCRQRIGCLREFWSHRKRECRLVLESFNV